MRRRGCARRGGLPRRQINTSVRVMRLSRPFTLNYKLITGLDHKAGEETLRGRDRGEQPGAA